MMKKALVISWLLLLLVAVCYQFWIKELKYSLPTPVPANYTAVQTGETVNLNGKVTQAGKPVFIHFFNPDCPCSKFNMPHFASLVRRYGNYIDFSVVVVDKQNKYTAEQIRSKYDLNLPVLFDTTIATTCGVYSTPQAVLLSADSKLYYRGNYNKSRFCTDAGSNYAQMAIDSFLHNQQTPTFNPLATKAYGCEIPSTNCKKLR